MATAEERQLQGNVYTGVVLQDGAHLTRYDPYVLPGSADLARSFGAGSQIVRLPEGGWLIGFSGQDSIYLSRIAADGTPQATSPMCIAGPAAAAASTSAAALPAARDVQVFLAALGGVVRPWLAWSEDAGIRLAIVEEQGAGLSCGARIACELPGARLTAGVVDHVGRIWLGVTLPVEQDTETGVVCVDAGGVWHYERLLAQGGPLSLAVDDVGRLHAAAVRIVPYAVPESLRQEQGEHALMKEGGGRNREPEIAYLCRAEQGGWSQPQVAAYGLAAHPVIAISAGRPLLVYQVEGHKKVAPRSDDYLFQREGGGAGIGYAWLGPSGWQRGDIATPEEILIQDMLEADVYKGRLYPMVEELWRPRLVSDCHGVVWAIWPNTTRRHTYFSRWLQGGWSDPLELHGSFYALSEHIALEAAPPAGAGDFAVAVLAAGRVYFLTVPAPTLAPGQNRHIMFLDMLDLTESRNLEIELNQFERYPDNPIMGPGPAGARDDVGVSFPHVRRFEGRYIMHYHMRGAGRASDQEGNRMGYAESDDGIHWVRPAIPPSSDPEVLPSGPDNSVPWASGNFIDYDEPDPMRRFKGANLTGKWTQTQERWLITSPDGKYWRKEGPAEDMYCILEAGGPSFRDADAPPETRFRAVGRSTATCGRALGMMYSPDLRHWQGKESLLNVDDPYGRPAMLRRGGYVSGRILDPIGERGAYQIYWGVVWKEHGLYLCLYAPYTCDGRYDVALAVSRDGFHFMRVKNGRRILPCGAAGTWDRGSIAVGYGTGEPLDMGDRLRIYYSASTGHHGTKPWGSLSCIGCADLPKDGYTYARVRWAAPGACGSLATLPFAVPAGWQPAVGLRMGPRKFYSGPGGTATRPAVPDGVVAAELLDTVTGLPAPGYAAAESRFVDMGDEQRINWPQADPAALAGMQMRLRLILRGSEVCLYSFWLA